MSLKSSMASVGFFRPIDTLLILTSRPVRFRTSLSTRDFAIGSRNRVNPATSRTNNKNSRNSHLKSFFIPALYHPRDAGDNPQPATRRLVPSARPRDRAHILRPTLSRGAGVRRGFLPTARQWRNSADKPDPNPTHRA